MSQLLDLVPTEIHDLEERDLNALVHEAVEFAELGAADAEVSVSEVYSPASPLCTVDADRVTRLLDNLLRNAFAHTPRGGEITVTTAVIGESLSVAIHNTGSYVAPEDRERVFQPFVSGRGNGTGLGLAIAQQIAYAHGGSIDLTSDETQGTTFTVLLPSAESIAPRPDTRPTLAGAA